MSKPNQSGLVDMMWLVAAEVGAQQCAVCLRIWLKFPPAQIFSFSLNYLEQELNVIDDTTTCLPFPKPTKRSWIGTKYRLMVRCHRMLDTKGIKFEEDYRMQRNKKNI